MYNDTGIFKTRQGRKRDWIWIYQWNQTTNEWTPVGWTSKNRHPTMMLEQQLTQIDRRTANKLIKATAEMFKENTI